MSGTAPSPGAPPSFTHCQKEPCEGCQYEALKQSSMFPACHQSDSAVKDARTGQYQYLYCCTSPGSGSQMTGLIAWNGLDINVLHWILTAVHVAGVCTRGRTPR